MSRKKVIFGGVVVFVIAVCIVLFFVRSKKPATINDEGPPQVLVATSVMAPVVRYIDAIGTLRPHDSVIIKSEVNAMISKIHFVEGAVVEANTLLMELDDSTAKAQLMEAEAAYRKAKSEYEPNEKLAGKGVVARIERDKKKAEMDMYEARVISSKANLEKHKIHAPFGGVVGLREVSQGQYVTSGNELLKIVDCHPLKVDFKIAEVDIGNVKVGDEIKVLVGGDKSKEYTAHISALDPESDKISHCFDVRAILDVPEEIAIESRELRPGRFVSVKVEMEGNQMGVVVPESALEKTGDTYYVYKIVDGVAITTPVTIGVRRDGEVEITSGMNEDEVVVISGQHGVLDGKPVSIQDPDQQQMDSLDTNSAAQQKTTATGSVKKGKSKKKKKSVSAGNLTSNG
ncbi:MAG: efflux RND transporter periplasmic adaptor subunit [Holosporaceae bacterium]|nr:efflux RND transporter periplasmic adaptor subunit [Holosporaceae bacterium]